MGSGELNRKEMKPLQVFVDESSLYFDRQTGQVYVSGQLFETKVQEPIILGRYVFYNHFTDPFSLFNKYLIK